MKRVFLQTLGCISLMLGVLGAFLPLLPSTCFILLATWLFSKSSPRFHHWLVEQSPFSESIQNWQKYRVITRKTKWIASASIFTSFALTVWLFPNPWLVTSLGISMAGLLAYLLTRQNEVLLARSNNVAMPVRSHG